MARKPRILSSANLRKNYPKPLLYSLLTAVAIANVFNLGADIGAMGDAIHLLVPGKVSIFVLIFGAASLIAVLFVPYSKYVRYLKWLTVSLFAYVGVAFFVHISWSAVARGALVPHIHLTSEYLTAWQPSSAQRSAPIFFSGKRLKKLRTFERIRAEKALKRAPNQADTQLERIRLDTYIRMALSNAVAFFIILTAASTLNLHGINQVSTSAQAASALEPIAGKFTFALFVCGIVGTGLLAVPVLAASAAYGIGEACRWEVSLERTPRQARRFYAVICAATLLGLLLNFLHIDPIKALFWSAVLNGLVSAPLMAVIMVVASSRKVMGQFVIPPYLKVVGWLATTVMFGVGAAVLISWR